MQILSIACFAPTWVHGLLNDTVTWRGNPLKVLRGTRLVPPAPRAGTDEARAEAA